MGLPDGILWSLLNCWFWFYYYYSYYYCYLFRSFCVVVDAKPEPMPINISISYLCVHRISSSIFSQLTNSICIKNHAATKCYHTHTIIRAQHEWMHITLHSNWFKHTQTYSKYLEICSEFLIFVLLCPKHRHKLKRS